MLQLYIPDATMKSLKLRWPNTWRAAAANAVIDLVNLADGNADRIADAVKQAQLADAVDRPKGGG